MLCFSSKIYLNKIYFIKHIWITSSKCKFTVLKYQRQRNVLDNLFTFFRQHILLNSLACELSREQRCTLLSEYKFPTNPFLPPPLA